MSEAKRSYTCTECKYNIVALVAEEGTIPHIIDDCESPRCSGQMWNDFQNVLQLTGKEPTHHLVRNAEAKTDKLELKKVVANE